jgi:hypothetical protein
VNISADFIIKKQNLLFSMSSDNKLSYRYKKLLNEMLLSDRRNYKKIYKDDLLTVMSSENIKKPSSILSDSKRNQRFQLHYVIRKLI